MGKTVPKSFDEGNLAANDYIDRIILLIKNNDPRGLSAPTPGLYTYIRSNCMFEWGKLFLSRIMEKTLQQRTILTE